MYVAGGVAAYAKSVRRELSGRDVERQLAGGDRRAVELQLAAFGSDVIEAAQHVGRRVDWRRSAGSRRR